jgi:hypothetical protein
MGKNKFEFVDEGSYYRGFKIWLDSSNCVYDPKNELQMNEFWLKFADEVGIYLCRTLENEKLMIEILDSQCWREAKKYYSILSFKAANREQISYDI